MKQFIVLIAMIALGVFLHQLIIGPQEGSILSEMKELWERMILYRGAF